ncbi:MAG: MMPL family transporter [Planctomycetota bacterium]|nr:MMPL family transporter [Planctomycetota bacterium]
MGFIHRQIQKTVLAVVTHPKLTLGTAGIVLVGCVSIALNGLTLSTDQNKLFSSQVPFFRNYLEFIAKFPENEAMYVIVERARPRVFPPVVRWTALADRIAGRLRAMPKYVKSVETGIPLDQLGAQGILFEEPGRLKQTLEEAGQFVPLVKLFGEKPDMLTGLLGPTPIERLITALATQKQDAQTLQFADLIASSLLQTLKHPNERLRVGKQIPDLAALDAADPSRLGYYYTTDETDPSRGLMLVRVYPREDFTTLTARCRIVDAIRAACREEARPFPEFKVGITGRPALDADEMRSTDRDSHRAEVVALIVIFIGLVIMFRSFWIALVAELTLAIAIGWAFGWATVSLGELNLLSIVFLIALIGIGMDYLIQILMAYQREARRYVRARAVWARVFHYVSPPVVTACLGAAGAFFVSFFTDFRGAAELGIIAGGGLLLCLLAGHTVLPAMLTLFPAKVKSVAPADRYGGRLRLWRFGKWRLILPCIWMAAIAAGVPFMSRAHFNPSLLDLQAANLESVQLIRKLQTWSAVVLSPDLEMLRRVRDSLAGASAVASTDSILIASDNYEWLQQHKNDLLKVEWAEQPPIKPGDLDRLQAKARVLADLIEKQASGPAAATVTSFRELASLLAAEGGPQKEATGERLSAWQRIFGEQLRKILAQLTPPPLNLAGLPSELRSRYVSADGTYALYINPKYDLWDRSRLASFVKEIEDRVAQVPNSPPVTGIAPNIHYSTAGVERAFYRATVYAFVLIFVLVLIDLRRLGQTLGAISVLALGLPMLVALMGLFGISWNFANFFGLPILIGAAHEYGVFMMHRYREALHDHRRVWEFWDVSDRALFLCAFVTSSSFAFFWALGHHQGLKSLGLVMALGSACIYLATILVLRPLLIRRLERHHAPADKAGVVSNSRRVR